MTRGDHRGQLAMAVVEAAIAAMLILAVIGAMVGISAVPPPGATGLDLTAATVAMTLGEPPHRAAVEAVCEGADTDAEAEIATALAAADRPGLRTQVQIGGVRIGPAVPVGPTGHDVLLLPGCRVEVWVWMV